MSSYGWVIDTDHQGDDTENSAGTVGPRHVSDAIVAELRAGKGDPFRMYDDDGRLEYSGRLLIPDPDTEPAPNEPFEREFAPLLDFGMPHMGCTEIRYRDDSGKWATL